MHKTAWMFAVLIGMLSSAAHAGAPGAVDASASGVGASTSGGEGNPYVKKVNQYALKSSTVIRQLLSDAKAL